MALKDLVLPSFDDPEVQIVYEMLCAIEEPPNPEEHWEGRLARNIIHALRSASTPDKSTEVLKDKEASPQLEN